MASNLKKILNTHSVASRDFLSSCFNSSLSMSQLADICVVEDEVTNAIIILVALSLISLMPLVFLLKF